MHLALLTSAYSTGERWIATCVLRQTHALRAVDDHQWRNSDHARIDESRRSSVAA